MSAASERRRLDHRYRVTAALWPRGASSPSRHDAAEFNLERLPDRVDQAPPLSAI